MSYFMKFLTIIQNELTKYIEEQILRVIDKDWNNATFFLHIVIENHRYSRKICMQTFLCL